MNVHSNVHLEPEKVMHCFGTRTLVLANNTKQRGMSFSGVVSHALRKGFTSSFSINKPKKDEEIYDRTIGVFFGKDVIPLDGVFFIGKTKRNGDIFSLVGCNLGGSVEEYGIQWRLLGSGWKADGHYEMQGFCSTNSGTKEWRSIRPSGLHAKPYRFDTKEAAQHMLDLCYSDRSEEEFRIKFMVVQK
ncbi:MAG: hypothetical protein KAH23_05895 [Kiritimatiellae bacterium]|nr:hypothetical protein [Kiritimatiellia bacterium]